MPEILLFDIFELYAPGFQIDHLTVYIKYTFHYISLTD